MFRLVSIVSFTLMVLGVARGNQYDCQTPEPAYMCDIFKQSKECKVIETQDVDHDPDIVNVDPITDVNFDINIYNLDTYYNGMRDTALYGNYSFTLTSDQMKAMKPTYFRIMVKSIWTGLHETVYYEYMVPKNIDYEKDSTFSFQECANVYTSQYMWVQVLGVRVETDEATKTYTKVSDSYMVVPDCCSDLGKLVSGCDYFCIDGVSTEHDPSTWWWETNEDSSENQVITTY